MKLADEALARGEIEVARGRYERILSYDSHSAHALVGLGRIALLEGRQDDARALLMRATRGAPDSVVLLALADLEAQSGNTEAARAALEAAVAVDPSSPEVHQRYLEFSGPAPRQRAANLENALAIADLHPYDPQARLVAGGWLAAEGRVEEAIGHFATAVWLTDINPAAGRTAFQLLEELDPTWAARRLVYVDAVADEEVRKSVGWRFRLRNQWVFASQQLDPLIHTWFVPQTIGEVSLADVPNDLEVLNDAFRRRVTDLKRPGISAAFTGRPFPRRSGSKLGLAEFLGRSLIVRLPPEESDSRVLVHELLHLYGGIHVAADLDSIMNPVAGSFKLDSLNQAIVREMRERDFRNDSFERNVVARVDASKAVDAYLNAIGANLVFRRMGVGEALEARSTSRYIARDKLKKARELDSHLGDVARVVAVLLVADERPAEALQMLEFAAGLYGRDSERGKQMQSSADRLSDALERKYGEPRPQSPLLP